MRPPAPLLFLALVLLALAWATVAQASTCVGPQPLSGSSPPISFSGAIGGNSGDTVDWYIFNNTYSSWWQQLNASTYTVEAVWIPEGEPGPTCSEPWGYSYNYVKRYAWTISNESWTTSYSGMPAFSTTVDLPPEGTYTFYWIIHSSEGDHFIYYIGNVTNQDPQEETNSLLGAILGAIRDLASSLLDIIKEAVVAAWNAIKEYLSEFLRMVLPDWLYDILSTAWDVVGSFAPPLFNLVRQLFEVYPLVFMVISAKYIVTGDIEGWIDYVWMHVKLIRIFIDFGFKIIEAVTP